MRGRLGPWVAEDDCYPGPGVGGRGEANAPTPSKSELLPRHEFYRQIVRTERGAEVFDLLSGWVQGFDARSAQDSFL